MAPTRSGAGKFYYLPTSVKGIWLYLYLVIDVWSRKVVAWDVESSEDPYLLPISLAGLVCANGSLGDPNSHCFSMLTMSMH